MPPSQPTNELVIVAFAPCVPFKQHEDDIAEGIVPLDSKRMRDPVTQKPALAEIVDGDLHVTLTVNGKAFRKQVYPRGLVSILYEAPPAPEEKTKTTIQRLGSVA